LLTTDSNNFFKQ